MKKKLLWTAIAISSTLVADRYKQPVDLEDKNTKELINTVNENIEQMLSYQIQILDYLSRISYIVQQYEISDDLYINTQAEANDS